MKKIIFAIVMMMGLGSSVFALNLEQFLNAYFGTLINEKSIPASRRYTQVRYTNIPESSKLYRNLQKAIYLDIFPNAKLALPLDKPLSQKQAMSIVRQWFSGFTAEVWEFSDVEVTVDWLRGVLSVLRDSLEKDTSTLSSPSSFAPANDPLFADVYQRIQESFIGTGKFNQKKLLQGTLQGFVQSLGDPYTSYFPPTQAKSFSDELQGQYYGIGAYVEMKQPGVFIITAPMKWSPAEQAGIKAGDRVVKVGEKTISPDTSLDEAISRIKWPENTSVKLQIYRDGKSLDMTVTRKKITVQNIETMMVGSGSQKSCILTMRMFDMGISSPFDSAMQEFAQSKCAKYIFDVRNNPGGSLEEVDRILQVFVPAGQTTIEIRSQLLTEDLLAKKTSRTAPLSGAALRILVNKWSASASEIFAGTIRDYQPNLRIIGEQTFGKWSVQEVVDYIDGSMLKYTIAKRYTGKSKTTIDGVGLSPDIVIKDDEKTTKDEVLEYAIMH